jgi:hypothetical protein
LLIFTFRLAQSAEHCVEALEVLLEGLALDDDVVDVRHCAHAGEPGKQHVHVALECGRRIGEAERHDLELEEAP